MASSKLIMASSAVLLVLLPLIMVAEAIDVPSSWTEEMCKEVECGKGNCTVANGSPFNFKCECAPGWKRTRLDNEDDLEFLPCIIPNCNVEYSCMPAPPPAPPAPRNGSFFDPCYYIYCGEGKCTKNSDYKHTCQCNPGYQNLLGIDAFPCYSPCSITDDCERLGIRVSNSSTTPTDSVPGNQATSFLPGKLHVMSIFLISMAVALWK